MNNLLYIVAVVLLVLWAVGYFSFKLNNDMIHVLLVIALVVVVVRLVQGRKIL